MCLQGYSPHCCLQSSLQTIYFPQCLRTETLSQWPDLSPGKLRGNLGNVLLMDKTEMCEENGLSLLLAAISWRCEAGSYSSSSHDHETSLRQNKLRLRQKHLMTPLNWVLHEIINVLSYLSQLYLDTVTSGQGILTDVSHPTEYFRASKSFVMEVFMNSRCAVKRKKL